MNKRDLATAAVAVLVIAAAFVLSMPHQNRPVTASKSESSQDSSETFIVTISREGKVVADLPINVGGKDQGVGDNRQDTVYFNSIADGWKETGTFTTGAKVEISRYPSKPNLFNVAVNATDLVSMGHVEGLELPTTSHMAWVSALTIPQGASLTLPDSLVNAAKLPPTSVQPEWTVLIHRIPS